MAAIQVHLLQVQVRLDLHNTGLPDFFQAAVRTPFAPMVIHTLPTRLLAALALGCVTRYRQTIPLTTVMQSIQNQVENADQRRLADVASFGNAQKGHDIALKLPFRYPFGDGAHAWILFGRSFSQS